MPYGWTKAFVARNRSLTAELWYGNYIRLLVAVKFCTPLILIQFYWKDNCKTVAVFNQAAHHKGLCGSAGRSIVSRTFNSVIISRSGQTFSPNTSSAGKEPQIHVIFLKWKYFSIQCSGYLKEHCFLEGSQASPLCLPFRRTCKQVFILSVFCLTTGPKPPPKRCLHIVRSRASSF